MLPSLQSCAPLCSSLSPSGGLSTSGELPISGELCVAMGSLVAGGAFSEMPPAAGGARLSAYSCVACGGRSDKSVIDAILPSAAERRFILATAGAGIGRTRNRARERVWRVANDDLLTDPFLFSVGNSVMHSSVRGVMEWFVFGTVA